MTKYMHPIMASGLALVAAISLVGCANRQAGQEQAAGPMEGPFDQRAEAPVEQRAAVQEAGDLNNLQTGQPLSYYNERFSAMGYEVRDVDFFNDRVVYDLYNGNQYYRVTLDRPANEQTVQNVAVRELAYTTGPNVMRDQTYTRVREQVLQSVQPGQEIWQYMPQLQKIGEVTKVERDAQDANVHLEVDGNEYVVEMKMDPNNRVVRGVEIDQSFWGS